MCGCVCVWVWVRVGSTPVSKGFTKYSVFQYFSFSVLRPGLQAAHPVLHQRRHWMSSGDIWPHQSDVPGMWQYRFLWFTHSGDRPQCVFFKTGLGTTAFSHARKHQSIWASWAGILSDKCASVRAYMCIFASMCCFIGIKLEAWIHRRLIARRFQPI